ncbi:MAG: PAS domain-containing protein [Deltaproteobacteria bacterium]|nr:PAS domain-containing protein [Deltaproteobacteria bacterium]
MQETIFEEGYWKNIIDTMMEGLMIVDTQGRILSVNQALEEITGYCREELIGQSCEILKCDTCFGAKIPPGQCDLFTKGLVRRCKCVMVRKDGRPLHVLKNAVVLKDHAGRVVGGVETLTDLSEVVAKEKVISRLRRTLSGEDGFHGLLGKSPVMAQLFTLIDSAAQSEAPVVIYGESGTGKELVASAIHRLSPRRKGPFIKVNSVALNENLLESELFGHVKGAFTGADRTRLGRFEAASGGAIFLDEVGDLPLATQAKLLRVLQEKVIEKVGDHKPIPVDVRVITATNKDLHHLMAQGRFREDLYYRIGVIPITLPPLRERREDIPLLVEAFVERTRLKTRKPITGISKEALDVLINYSWPGNVRELLNVIEYAFVLCPEGVILPDHLPAQVLYRREPYPARPRTGARSPSNERQLLMAAIAEAGGKMGEAARLLGISRVTLWKRLKAYDIQVDRVIRG